MEWRAWTYRVTHLQVDPRGSQNAGTADKHSRDIESVVRHEAERAMRVDLNLLECAVVVLLQHIELRLEAQVCKRTHDDRHAGRLIDGCNEHFGD